MIMYRGRGMLTSMFIVPEIHFRINQNKTRLSIENARADFCANVLNANMVALHCKRRITANKKAE